MNLILPRFVLIDSSVFTSWAQDACSKDPKLRISARTIQESLFNNNWIPTVSLHHFIELARHSDIDIARRKIDFLRSLPSIAWFGRSYNSKMLGSVVDIFEAEVATLIAFPSIDIRGLKNAVRTRTLQYGPPSNVPMLSDWEFMHSTLKSMGTREQEIASVLHTEGGANDDIEIGKLSNIQTSNFPTFAQPLIEQIAKVTGNLSHRGDPRLIDPNQTAREFIEIVAANLAQIAQRSPCALDAFIEHHDVPRSDVTSTTTLGEFKRLARLRKLVRDVVPQIGMDLELVWPILRDALIPSEILLGAIRKARRSSPRASGSDLGDDYLICHAPYADRIIVDKRTHEFLKQISRRDSYIREIMGSFTKVASYKHLPAALAIADAES